MEALSTCYMIYKIKFALKRCGLPIRAPICGCSNALEPSSNPSPSSTRSHTMSDVPSTPSSPEIIPSTTSASMAPAELHKPQQSKHTPSVVVTYECLLSSNLYPSSLTSERPRMARSFPSYLRPCSNDTGSYHR